MDKLNLNINGFKCFVDKHFELSNMTLLTGANASGKSSVVQALLFSFPALFLFSVFSVYSCLPCFQTFFFLLSPSGDSLSNTASSYLNITQKYTDLSRFFKIFQVTAPISAIFRPFQCPFSASLPTCFSFAPE